ncbi:MAG: cysteine desulfurase, partial [Deltaproteobacteria bacterium]|nr:cysteine desulfurase [Deltaproteobacteria bacterium]
MIYLDHNATTPLDQRVLVAMVPFFQESFGNASSVYRLGRDAKAALEQARTNITAVLGLENSTIIFTSGGTEANNLAIKGVAAARHNGGNHIITAATEHHAVLNPCQQLKQQGFEVTVLPVDSAGLVDPEAVRRAINPRTILISIMTANNETGVIQPIAAIGSIAREQGVLLHSDAVQAAGKIPLQSEHCDLISLSAHKLYGPKGVGVLALKRGTPLAAQIDGGHHEQGLRAGTENIPGAVGLAKALQVAAEMQAEETARITALRERFESGLADKIEGVLINGADAPRLPNTSNVSFPQVDGESVLLHLDLLSICASSGSACTTGLPEPSHVL